MWERFKKLFLKSESQDDAVKMIHNLADPKSDMFDPEFAEAMWEEYENRKKK